MKQTWTPEQIALLKEKYPNSKPDELAILFPDKKKKAIGSKAKVLGLMKTVQKFRFSKAQIEYLHRHYARTQNKDLAIKIGCSIHTIENKGFALGLKKDKDFVVEMARENMKKVMELGKSYRYQKGQSPVNKGKKQSEYMSEEAIERTKATRFKKGSIPPGAVPIGYERMDRNGYIHIKVEGKRKLVLKHRHIWEQHNGTIPKGYNIQFKDGDRHNCDIDNLYLISKQDQMKTENSASLNLPDSLVAMYLAGKRGQDKELIEQLKQHPELLELKRQQIKLNRKIKKHGSN